MKYLALLLASALSLSAQIFTGGFSASAPYSTGGAVVGSGGLTLRGNAGAQEFTFSAANWSFSGGLTLETPGNYVISGFVSASGGIRGPVSGSATVRFASGGAVTGSLASNVRILTGNEQAPPVTPPVTPPVAVRENPPLLNISTRATLAAGQILNPGFVVGGTQPRRVLIRAIGPALAAFGVGNALAAPVLTVFSGQTQIGQAAGWGPELAAVFSAVGAFALPPGSRDAALVLTLAPGSYTAQIGGGAGEVLAEVYFVD